jgi:alkyldihydroxyacetonephosphate synthase
VTRPTPPLELTGTGERFGPGERRLDDSEIATLRSICTTTTDEREVAEASRDWWPLALHWSLAGSVPRRAVAVCAPSSTDEVAALVRFANERGIPVTVAGGRSGVCGASVPLHGGIVLDTTSLAGVVSVDVTSGIVEVLPGTFGPDLEEALAPHDLTVGHYPQSVAISTVGGWIACRGAGQYSTRYGKIEDMVVGLEVVLADGTVIRTGGAPRAATGPDLTQLVTGSEGTLGVITRAWLRAHPRPNAERRGAWWFDTFADGIEACRRIIRRGATPAVLRLYDAAESARGHGGDGRRCALLVLDEGDLAIVDATMGIVEHECRSTGAQQADLALVEAWMHHRNDTSGLQALTRRGYVVDTMEIAASWSRLAEIIDAAESALLAVPSARAATCHLSHSYLDGACLYFTFAATPPPDGIESTYRAMWDAGTRAVLAAGGNLSHHHGVGLNRSRFVGEALGSSHQVTAAVKAALDPNGILNPGKMGLPSPFGPDPYTGDAR